MVNCLIIMVLLGCALGREGERRTAKIARRHHAATSAVIYSYSAKANLTSYDITPSQAESIEKKIRKRTTMLLDQTVFESITKESPQGDMLSAISSAGGQI